MATDQFGNYVCDIDPGPVLPVPRGLSCCNTGEGVPSDDSGNDGMTYVDLSTGDLYVKFNGHWTLVSGSGATGLFVLGVVEPEGVVTANPGTGYVNTALSTVWIKQTGTGSSGWQQFI